MDAITPANSVEFGSVIIGFSASAEADVGVGLIGLEGVPATALNGRGVTWRGIFAAFVLGIRRRWQGVPSSGGSVEISSPKSFIGVMIWNGIGMFCVVSLRPSLVLMSYD